MSKATGMAWYWKLALVAQACAALWLGFAHYQQAKELESLQRSHNCLLRNHYFNQTIDAVYFKPMIRGEKPVFDYRKTVEVASHEWFPPGWQDDYKPAW